MHHPDRKAPNPGRYSGLSKFNHWITAVAVAAMLTLGLAAGEAPESAEDYIVSVHIALGFFVLLLVLWRTGWRLVEGFRPNPGADALERHAAWWVHRLLLTALVVLVLTGPLYLFTEGEGMDVFGWFTFRVPLSGLEAIHEPVEAIHKFTGEVVLPILLGLHVAGAARHWLAGGGGERAGM